MGKIGLNTKRQPLKTGKQKDVKGKSKKEHTSNQKRLLKFSESDMGIKIIDPNQLGVKPTSLPKTKNKKQKRSKKIERNMRQKIYIIAKNTITRLL